MKIPESMQDQFATMKKQVSEMTDEQRRQVLSRHKSLGVAMGNNDLEWANVYIFMHEEAGKGAVAPDIWEQIIFKASASLDARSILFMLDQGVDLFRLYEAQRPGESDAAMELVDITQILVYNKANDAVKSLVESGILPIDHANPFGEGILQQALIHGNYELADWALEQGADINRANLRTMTALHQAATNMRLDAVAWCMANGADPTIETFQRTTASEIVPDNGDPRTEQLYDILEDYAEAYRAGARSHVDERLDAMRAPEEDEDGAEPGPATPRTRPPSP